MIDTYKHRGLRQSLVKTIKAKGIKDQRILDAILKIPRHFFIDSAFEVHAYQDKPFSIGEGQTISQPFTVALQTELLEIKKGDKVLEIGTGSGYQASVLMEMEVELYTIERIRNLYTKARNLLNKIGYNPKFFFGDGTKGLPSHAPFDKIIVTAGAPKVPETLIEQLKVGGIMVIPVGNEQVQSMVRVIKTEESKVIREDYGACSFVKLKGEHGWSIN